METITKQFKYREQADNYINKYFLSDSSEYDVQYIGVTNQNRLIKYYMYNGKKIAKYYNGRLQVNGNAVLRSQNRKIYQFQTINGRKFNIYAANQAEAEDKAIDWKNRNAPNCCISYNFRVN